MSASKPWPVRGAAALLVLVLASVSSRTSAAEDSSFTRESRKPKASRRALLAATTRETVTTSLESGSGDLTAAWALPPEPPTWRAAPVSLRKDRALLLQTTRPEYLRPYSRGVPDGVLSPPA